MTAQSYLPPADIAGYVSSILVISHPGNTAITIPLFANGSPTLLFHTAKATGRSGNAGHLWLHGQTIQPSELSFSSSFTLIAYFLHPHALKSLFGMDAKSLTDQQLEMHSLQFVKESALQERLLNTSSASHYLQLINQFLLKLSHRSPFDYSRLAFATDTLKKTGGGSLSELQYQLNTSERSLQRLFETNVGISPKLFKRVSQFHAAFQQLNGNDFSKLTDIAYAHGFADQSHFIRVFREFSGLTPRQYMEKSAPYNPKF